jgi:hypothetical protein
MNAIQIIEQQEQEAAVLMRDFGLSYTRAMIFVLDCQNKGDGAEDEDGGSE